MLPENNTYGPWPLSGEFEVGKGTIQARTCPDASPISGEIDIMEARGNGPAYPAQYAVFILSSPSVPRFLTETISLQRHRLRSRIVKLGSIDVAERRVEDVRMVDSAAINVRRQVPHIFPRMDRGFPVRFKLLFFSPRSLIPEKHNKTHTYTYTVGFT